MGKVHTCYAGQQCVSEGVLVGAAQPSPLHIHQPCMHMAAAMCSQWACSMYGMRCFACHACAGLPDGQIPAIYLVKAHCRTYPFLCVTHIRAPIQRLRARAPVLTVYNAYAILNNPILLDACHFTLNVGFALGRARLPVFIIRRGYSSAGNYM